MEYLRKRERRYPHPQMVNLTHEQFLRLREASEMFRLAPGVIARDALALGLEKAIAKRQKSI